jgi:hypothetical protein
MGIRKKESKSDGQYLFHMDFFTNVIYSRYRYGPSWVKKNRTAKSYRICCPGLKSISYGRET